MIVLTMKISQLKLIAINLKTLSASLLMYYSTGKILVTVYFHSNLLHILIDKEISAYSFGKALEKLSNVLLLRNVLYLEIFF